MGPVVSCHHTSNLPAFSSGWMLPYAMWVDFFLVQTQLFHAAISYNILMSEIGLAHPGTWIRVSFNLVHLQSSVRLETGSSRAQPIQGLRHRGRPSHYFGFCILFEATSVRGAI